MTSKREIWRDRARARRAVAKSVALQQAQIKREHVREVLINIRTIVSNEHFIKFIGEQGVDSAPQRLLKRGEAVSPSQVGVSYERDFAESIFDFIIAWKFMFPLISDPRISNFIEENWPGLIFDLKDTFIALVMDGPFPQERRTQLRVFR